MAPNSSSGIGQVSGSPESQNLYEKMLFTLLMCGQAPAAGRSFQVVNHIFPDEFGQTRCF